ncbi:MAG TPA: CGGC domain-containing protein [Methanocella sp.]|jgi:predicted metal-binding protein
MTKIGIIRCDEKAKICPGTTCFQVIRDKKAAFEKYSDAIEIVGFDTCGGCGLGKADKILAKVENLKQRGAEVIHVSTCIKSKCPYYGLFVEEVGKHSKVDGNTH